MKRYHKTATLAAAASLLMSGVAAADDRYVFGEVYVVNHDERIPTESESAAGFRLGAGVPVREDDAGRTSVEFGLFSNPIEFNNFADERQTGFMIDVVHALKLGTVKPYAQLGLGAVSEFRDLSPAVEVGAGVLVGLTEKLDLRWGVQAQWVNGENDDYLDLRGLLGLARSFGNVATASPPPAPADADADGIPDSADRCPAQPAPTVDGCPTPLVPAEPERDTDADGVPDSKDECSDTLSGLEVDGSGCVTKTAQKVILKGVNFVSGSAELTADASKVLDDAAEALTGQTNLKVEIGGHTDSTGEAAMNASLSQRRADSVKKYLTDKGIAADRLAAKGYGESQPIADNMVKAGRLENRRVELTVLN